MDREDDAVSGHAKGFGHFYTLWALIALTDNLPPPTALAPLYVAFMQKVQLLGEQQDLDAFLRGMPAGEYALPLAYLSNSRGPSTDLGPRRERLDAMKTALIG